MRLFNRHSIFFKLNLLFIIVAIMFVLLASTFYRNTVKNHNSYALSRLYIFSTFLNKLYNDEPISDNGFIFLKYFDDEEDLNILIDSFKQESSQENKRLKEVLDRYDFELIIDDSEKIYILKRSRKMRPPSKNRFFKNKNHFKNRSHYRYSTQKPFYRNIKYLRYKKNYFLFIKGEKDQNWLIRDNSLHTKLQTFYLICTALALLLISLYIALHRTFTPIKKLIADIRSYGKNEKFDYPYETKQHKKDEISLIGNELYMAILQIEQAHLSKHFFLRNLMHEIKTPITKGKLAISLMQEAKTPSLEYIETLQKAFLRLEDLTNQLTQIEKLSSDVALQKSQTDLKTLIKKSKDLLIGDLSENIIYDDSDLVMCVDAELFVLVLKNLIDNAIKYAHDKKVYINVRSNSIIFSNKGEQLPYPFANYVEPFFKGDLMSHNINSSGLGLYIVNSIVDKHGFILKYDFKEDENSEQGEHRFMIDIG